jgi:hypothetical protein
VTAWATRTRIMAMVSPNISDHPVG